MTSTIAPEAPNLGLFESQKASVLAAIENGAESALEMAISYCESEVRALDQRRWELGDIGAAFMDKANYGQATVRRLADAIGVRRSWMYQCIKVSKFYDVESRDRWDGLPVTYTHMRDAMKLGSITDANNFLEEVANNGWTTEVAGIEVLKRVGKPVPAQVIFDATGYIKQVDLPSVAGQKALLFMYPGSSDTEALWSAKINGFAVQIKITAEALPDAS